MAGFLEPGDFAKPFPQIAVGVAIAQPRAQVMLGNAEEAGPDFAVGGQSDPVAMAAKWFADRRDDADLPARRIAFRSARRLRSR